MESKPASLLAESYQLKITGKSSSITAASSAKFTLEKAVMLALAVERFKKKLGQQWGDGLGSEASCFQDTDLLGNFNALVEGELNFLSGVTILLAVIGYN